MCVAKTLLVLTFILLLGCGPKEQKESVVVQSIQQTGQLVTVEYSLSKMIKATDNKTWYKLGERRILLSAQATVKAGVDLQTVTPDDVTINEKSIQLRLPAPQVFSVSIPPDKIKVLYQDVAFFRSRFSASEREDLLRQAEKQVRSLTDSLGILQTAQTNAETFLRNLLQQGGFQTIRFEFVK
jgi:hypothetical protein